MEKRIQIREVPHNKKQYLLAHEQENMVDGYLKKGHMYVLEEVGSKRNA